MTVDQQAKAGFHEFVGDLAIFKRQQSTLSGSLGEFDGFIDQVFRVGRFVEECLDGDGSSAEELAQAELHHRHQRGAAQYHEQRRRIHKGTGRPAQHN